ncbi:mannitol dehydrogenase family protein [Carnimonas bestiolae]|uniref:mannitol dehydrogenase family protein n=1 Tax=Carnimonas bestiolae TaxID=3402172 RepID=UPI003EDCA3F8
MSDATSSDAPAKQRLCRETLRKLPDNIRLPRYDVSRLKPGILHFGCGAFHRAHQALVTQRAIEAEGKEGMRWGIASASLVRTNTPDALRPQQGLYTLLERSAKGNHVEVVGSLAEVVHAPSDEKGMAARLADPETRIVTLTITDRGYFLDPSTHRLNVEDETIKEDVGQERPTTAIGSIVRGLELTRKAGHTPPVILCCDNLTSNGTTLRQAVLDFAALEDDGLSQWIEGNVQFPNTMVDRIAPSVTERDIEETDGILGVHDAAPVVAEPFLDWVIEDFDGPRPAWDKGGAKFVSDVEPYEIAKLRLLNGTHMLLAYIGSLAGYKTIAEAIADPLIKRLTERFMRSEQGPTVPVPHAQSEHYIDELLKRFENPAIHHEVGRVGRNGSLKLATRLLEPMRYNLAERRDTPCTILAIAAWIRGFSLLDTSGTAIRIDDPNKEEIYRLCRATRENPLLRAETFLEYDEVFGEGFPRQDKITGELAQALNNLHRYDLREVIAATLDETILGKRYAH